MTKKTPTIFIGHGSPMNALADNDFTQRLTKLGGELESPKSILMVSAHWETNGVSLVTGMEKPKTIHDFYGFPKPLYQEQYPAPGSPALAKKVVSLLGDDHCQIDKSEWGLDHGTWSVLKFIFPKADIPIVQLSIDRTKGIDYHYFLAEKLESLREEGVMIMGSGNIVHNLKLLDWDTSAKPHPWALEYDQWIKEQLENKNYSKILSDYRNSERAKLSIPTLEHFLPLIYVLGASSKEDKLSFIFDEIQNASIAMRSLKLGN